MYIPHGAVALSDYVGSSRYCVLDSLCLFLMVLWVGQFVSFLAVLLVGHVVSLSHGADVFLSRYCGFVSMSLFLLVL